MAQEAVRFGQTLRETPCTVVQAISLGDEIAVLLTLLDADGRINPQLRPLSIDPKHAASTANRLAYALSRMPPDARNLELDKVSGWPDLRQALRDAVADLPTGEPLCIVPGPLSSTVFSLAFGDSQTICFVPSLGALMALRARRRKLPRGLRWRPASVFSFATWFAGEAPAQTEALNRGVDAAAKLAAARELRFESSTGAEATGQHLLDGLAAADLACIACHGRILPEAEAVDLIVAANGRLPPGDLSQLLDAHRAPHVLGWRQLAELKSASSVVLSSACNSGLAVLHRGGERLGLERSLFQAGTLAYVAPQWPVPTVETQDLALAIIQDWLTQPSQSLMAAVARQREAALQAGVSPLVACAFAVFGDGL